MRSYKTSQIKRTSYIYYSADGEKITITPDDGVTETHIELLHCLDDAEVNQQRRHSHMVPVHLDNYSDYSDHNPYLSDDYLNPETVLIKHESELEHQRSLSKLGEALKDLLPQQKELLIKVYQDGRTCSEIAREEGVTEAAIRNRLKKVHEKIKKYLL